MGKAAELADSQAANLERTENVSHSQPEVAKTTTATTTKHTSNPGAPAPG
jgi:hypothetical protein